MELNDVVFGKLYKDRKLGTVLVCGAHPHDGACLIVELCNDPDVICTFDITEADCLMHEMKEDDNVQP